TPEEKGAVSDAESFEALLEKKPEQDLDKEEAPANDLLDRLQRLQAEFENYKKRVDSRSREVAKSAREGVLLKLLEVYDNIERAMEFDFKKNPAAAKEGIGAIEKQISKILSLEDVRRIEPLNKEFDPYYQHAVNRTSNPNLPDGNVVEVYQKGYMLREKVLRPAMVCVNRHESPSADEIIEDVNEISEKDSE
ncbi:MAG: nucleotide exchange factor GrpE, partial [Candidatus Thorarchaeota archaeon]|nr:nucleotide exchange factor GrpE [Candidatus Thorarchaeota archaeon]